MILNLTGRDTTDAQSAAGVVDPSAEDKRKIRSLLEIADPFTDAVIGIRSMGLANVASASGYSKVMIGGPISLLPMLEHALSDKGINCCYARPDGGVGVNDTWSIFPNKFSQKTSASASRCAPTSSVYEDLWLDTVEWSPPGQPMMAPPLKP